MRVVRAFGAFLCVLASCLLALPAFAAEPAWLGLELDTVSEALVAEKGLSVEFGAYVRAVLPQSPAQGELKTGDVVTSIDGKLVKDKDELQAVLATRRPGDAVQLGRARTGEAAKKVKVTLIAHPHPRVAVAIDGAPRLMLDTGGHTASIKEMILAGNGRLLISGSEDKVVRVWDWQAGTTLRTIRGQAGDSAEGQIYTIALSPDGKLLAVGGYLGSFTDGKPRMDEEAHKIRLYDFATGELKALLKGHENVVNNLAFSPDGTRLLSGSGDRTAKIWDVASGTVLRTLSGHQAQIYTVAYLPDGKRVVTGSLDNTLKLWNADTGAKIADMTGHADKVFCVTTSKNGSIIASGSADGEIRFWDGTTGAFVKSFAKQGGLVGALEFTPDGKSLLSTCGYRGCDSAQRVWDVATGKLKVTYKEHNNIVIAAAISADGKLAFTGGGDSEEIHVWEVATGKRVTGANGVPIRLVGNGTPSWAVAFSADGKSIAWGQTPKLTNANDRGPLEFTLKLPEPGGSLSRPTAIDPAAVASYQRGTATAGNLKLEAKIGGKYGMHALLEIQRDGKPIAVIERKESNGYQHRTFTFTPGGRSVISAGDKGHLSEFDLNGKVLGEFVGHVGDIWSVAVSPNGKLLVSGGDDQTVRLWNIETHELIATMFYGTDGEWVIWTEQGYYAGSPKGGELVGWQLNRGPAKAADYVRGKQLRDKLFRPDVISKAIELSSANAAVKALGLEGVDVGSILSARPPEVALDANPRGSGGHGTILISIADSEHPVTSVSVFVSAQGKPEANVTPKKVPLPDGYTFPRPGFEPASYEVPLYEGRNTIRVAATNEIGESAPQTATIQHTGEGSLDKRGTLRILAIGVDKYPGAGKVFKNLDFAGSDATVFAETASKRMGPLHETSKITVLVNGGKDGEPTRARIEEELARLEREALDRDTVAVFYAGHGEAWAGGQYHVMATDLVRQSVREPGVNFVDWSKIQGAVTRAKGRRRLIFVDACHAGSLINSHNDKLTSDALTDRFVAFAATSPNQNARERSGERHGVFTAVLIDGLFKAIDPDQGAVTVYRLGTFVNEGVSRLTGGQQLPEFNSGAGNFTLAR